MIKAMLKSIYLLRFLLRTILEILCAITEKLCQKDQVLEQNYEWDSVCEAAAKLFSLDQSMIRDR